MNAPPFSPVIATLSQDRVGPNEECVVSVIVEREGFCSGFFVLSDASSFVLADLRLGKYAYFASEGAWVPAVFFQDDPPLSATPVRLEKGMILSVRVTNLSSQTRRFGLAVLEICAPDLALSSPPGELDREIHKQISASHTMSENAEKMLP